MEVLLPLGCGGLQVEKEDAPYGLTRRSVYSEVELLTRGVVRTDVDALLAEEGSRGR